MTGTVAPDMIGLPAACKFIRKFFGEAFFKGGTQEFSSDTITVPVI
ncbi:hypothetical protein [Komagataeibacter diospyri]|nr:hypothetical protein [Komagataeibacter diospyri]